MTMTSLEEFRQLASRGNLIPVVAEIVGDVETPVGAFQKIGRDRWSFLFESAERNEESGRFSLIGIDPLLIVSQCERDLAVRERSGAVTRRSTSDPLGELQKVLGEFRFVPRDDIPHFQGGAVGVGGYDVVRFFEPKVPIHLRDDLELPEMMFMVAGTLIVFDHRFRLMRIIVSADLRRQSVEVAYAGANKQVQILLEKLAASSRLQPIAAPAAGDDPSAEFKSNTIDFEKMVLRAKEYIGEGDIFQVVLSQRFESEFSADPLDLYRCLRFGNPSPYMFLLEGLPAFDAFRAAFPAGTVSGTPKIRAMQIIAELEKARRGFYAGAVGWFGFDGNCDSCIALRSVVLKNGRAFVQAGAGIVADSEPVREREETERKIGRAHV